jgi:hypothetical protein
MGKYIAALAGLLAPTEMAGLDDKRIKGHLIVK